MIPLRHYHHPHIYLRDMEIVMRGFGVLRAQRTGEKSYLVPAEGLMPYPNPELRERG